MMKKYYIQLIFLISSQEFFKFVNYVEKESLEYIETKRTICQEPTSDWGRFRA